MRAPAHVPAPRTPCASLPTRACERACASVCMCQRECGNACSLRLLSVHARVHAHVRIQVGSARFPYRCGFAQAQHSVHSEGRAFISGASPETPEWTVRCGVPVSSEDAKVADANHLRVHLIDICVHVCEHECTRVPMCACPCLRVHLCACGRVRVRVCGRAHARVCGRKCRRGWAGDGPSSCRARSGQKCRLLANATPEITLPIRHELKTRRPGSDLTG
jgi:hypothetical protein